MREQLVRVGLAMFTLGVLFGVSASWSVARHLERYRRARTDIRMSIDSAKGYASRAWAEARHLGRVGGYTLLVAGAVVLVVAGVVTR